MAKAKFSDEKCLEFYDRVHGKDGTTVKELAEEYGVSYSTMCKYVNMGGHMRRDIESAKRELARKLAEKIAKKYDYPFVQRYYAGGFYDFVGVIDNLLLSLHNLEELKSDKIEELFERKLLNMDISKRYEARHYHRYEADMFAMWFQLTHRKEIVI